MTVSEAASQVLFGKSLSEKLQVAPFALADTGRLSALSTPASPTREKEFALSETGVRASFPGVNRLDQTQARGELLHFLANHELLAAELMALVLLKFPDAPEAYRRGVYEAMREEQMHTLMYIRRMKDCGLEFGQLPLNSYFWRLVSPVNSPVEFVTKLNLTFEQANLDFSRHYAGLFAQVGDGATAAVLEKIYQDEISHVGHGIHWFREWKSPGQSDWEAFEQAQKLPFSAAKAKGLAPFNAEGRRLAGLGDHFINELSVYQQSRGRTPVLHLFNPNAEFFARIASAGGSPVLPAAARDLETDLEILMMGVCRNDDLLLLRQKPSSAHLRRLVAVGFALPELVECPPGGIADRDMGGITDRDMGGLQDCALGGLQDCALGGLQDRALGGLRPWAWCEEAATSLKGFAPRVSPRVTAQWRVADPPAFFSKRLGSQLEATIGERSESYFGEVEGVVWQRLKAILNTGRAARVKGAFSCAGREQRTFLPTQNEGEIREVVQRLLAKHGGVVVEPFYEKVAEFSAHYELGEQVTFKGYTVMETSSDGQYEASLVSKKWSQFLPPAVREFLFREGRLAGLYQEVISEKLPVLLPHYGGPVGVDALVYRNEQHELSLKPVLEVNVRYTMGRTALEILKRRGDHAGKLAITPSKVPLRAAQIPLNDPRHARRFQATWEVL